MKKFLPKLAFLICSFGICSVTAQAANAPVNIAYPVNASSVNNYFHSYFTTTCPGGMNSVRWLLDSTVIGYTTFYDVASVQFAHKLPTGWHSLQVISSCGQDAVKFYVN